MDRISEKFAELKLQGRKALIAYIPGGWPDFKTCGQVVRALNEAGVDILEIGVPFSDPIADGPTIQAASQEALAHGASLRKILDFCSHQKYARRECVMPLVLMSYANPVFAFGVRKFMREAAESGVSGLIIPDLIPEESQEWRQEAELNRLGFIHLVAPTTSESRRQMVAEASTGFIYVVSVTGITGARQTIPVHVKNLLQSLREITGKPLAVGFGISSPLHVRALKPYADGLIVGSALIDTIRQGRDKAQAAVKFIKSLRGALDEN